MDLPWWFFKVCNLLQLSGFAEVWLFPESVNVLYQRKKEESKTCTFLSGDLVLKHVRHSHFTEK